MTRKNQEIVCAVEHFNLLIILLPIISISNARGEM